MKKVKDKKSLFRPILFLILIIIGYMYTYNGGAINDRASTINVNGVTREYVLYIPSTYDSKTPVPLMLFFHG